MEKALDVMDRKQLSSYRQEAFKKQGTKAAEENAAGKSTEGKDAAGESAVEEKAAGKNVYLERIGSCEYFTVDRLFLQKKLSAVRTCIRKVLRSINRKNALSRGKRNNDL